MKQAAVLVGRTNVGKSTLFNRLIGRTRAIVSAQAGTTRDLNQGIVKWSGVNFWLMDTGGSDPNANDPAGKLSVKQMERAVAKACVLILVIDGQTGLLPADRNLAQRLRKLKKPVILVINKIDSLAKRTPAEKISLGFKDTFLVSAQNGNGLGDLLDCVIKYLPTVNITEPKLKLVLLGKTNVGKSSLFNKLLKEERSIVLSTPHTTRDKLHDYIEIDNTILELIDTAGIRRQLTKANRLEQQSVEQSLEALEEIDVAILVIDAASEPTWQEQRLGGLIVEAQTACVVLLNKADLVPFDQRKDVIKKLGRFLPMLSFASILWVSAKSGEGIDKIIPEAKIAAVSWSKTLDNKELVHFFNFLKKTKTTSKLPLTELEQIDSKPPRFLLHLKTKENPPWAIGQWVETKLRQFYNFKGTPVKVRLMGLRKK